MRRAANFFGNGFDIFVSHVRFYDGSLGIQFANSKRNPYSNVSQDCLPSLAYALINA